MKRILIYSLCASICLLPLIYWIPPAKCKIRAKIKQIEETRPSDTKTRCCCSTKSAGKSGNPSKVQSAASCKNKGQIEALFKCVCKYLGANKPVFLTQPISHEIYWSKCTLGTNGQKFISPPTAQLKEILWRHLNSSYSADITLVNCALLT